MWILDKEFKGNLLVNCFGEHAAGELLKYSCCIDLLALILFLGSYSRSNSMSVMQFSGEFLNLCLNVDSN